MHMNSKQIIQNKMTSEILKTQSKEEVVEFIRQRLKFNGNFANNLRYVDEDVFKKEHRRFDMSGYETETGQCTVVNLSILNTFADLGIYDFTNYLFLDFYKGQPTLYLKYFNDNENLEFELDGSGTVEIIFEIFQKTIFSGKHKRRRI